MHIRLSKTQHHKTGHSLLERRQKPVPIASSPESRAQSTGHLFFFSWVSHSLRFCAVSGQTTISCTVEKATGSVFLQQIVTMILRHPMKQ